MDCGSGEVFDLWCSWVAGYSEVAQVFQNGKALVSRLTVHLKDDCFNCQTNFLDTKKVLRSSLKYSSLVFKFVQTLSSGSWGKKLVQSLPTWNCQCRSKSPSQSMPPSPPPPSLGITLIGTWTILMIINIRIIGPRANIGDCKMGWAKLRISQGVGEVNKTKSPGSSASQRKIPHDIHVI